MRPKAPRLSAVADPDSYETILESGIRARTREVVAARDPQHLIALVAEAAALAEGLLAALRERDPPEAPAACREGCAYCCHYQVAVSPPEAFAIAAHLRATRNADDLAELAATCARLAAEERGFDPAARIRARRPCVLLADGRCSIYAARPLACRGANATDAATCEAALDGADVAVTLYVHQANAMKAAARGLNHAADARDGHLELTAALAVTLEDEDAAARWLAGEPLFADARLPSRPTTKGTA